MNAQAELVLKDLAHLAIDKELAVLISMLAAKLPPSLGAVEAELQSLLLPQVIKFLDAKIDAIGA